MRHFGQTNFPVAPRAQIRSAKTAAAEGLCNISALAPTTSPCAMLPAIFSVDAGVSEIPAWSFLDAIPLATRCRALDAVALADFSTAKTNAIAPQCVGGIGLQGALAQKGMTVVAELWQRTPSKLQRFSWRFSRCSVRHEYARDANSEGEHHA